MQTEFTRTATLDQTDWDVIDRLIVEFESHWRLGQPLKLSELDLPESGVVRERVLVELIKVDQEFRCRTGMPRRLEVYFEEWPE